MIGDLEDWIGKLKRDFLASDRFVDVRESVHFVLESCLLRLFQVDLLDLLSIQLDSNAATDNLSRIDQISQVPVVNSGQCATAWTLLFLRQTVLATQWLRDDAALKITED